MKLKNISFVCCFRYHKGTDFQANHNRLQTVRSRLLVVLDTTKVQIFKQITTVIVSHYVRTRLFQIPQRYRFSSKSQPQKLFCLHLCSCFRYHKGTDFQANHNARLLQSSTCALFQIPQRYRFSSKSQLQYKQSFKMYVVLDTTKVQIFKQITTQFNQVKQAAQLFQIPQRYRFSSKSQQCLTVNM